MEQEHVNNLAKGKDFWNEWRKHNTDIEPDFREAQLTDMDWRLNAPLKRRDLRGYDLSRANFFQANLSAVDLTEANLSEAHLNQASLEEADLTRANLQSAWVEEANLCKAIFQEANLCSAELWGSDLSRADCRNAFCCQANLGAADLFKANFSNACLRNSNLEGARLVETNFSNVDLTGSSIWGISAWDLILEGANQDKLIITPKGSSEITVDNLEVAQFIYLLLRNQKLRNIIDTISSKAVLILGRFTQERKLVLDAIRDALRQHNFVPIIFDFDRPNDRDFTETIVTLTGMCRFVVVDITNPKSSPLELQATVPNYMIPFVPIIQKGENPFSMFQDIQNKYDWVLETLEYDSTENLLEGLDKAIICPALQKSEELMSRKARELKTRDIHDYL
jgi:uncharacterized protein YjbI with pentapeptide repeats